MALLKYLRPLEEMLDPSGPLSSVIPSKTIVEVNKEVREAKIKEKKRGEYTRLTQKEKAMIAKYASEHGVTKAVKRYSDKDVKESSVRDWKKMYEKELRYKCKGAEPGQEIVVDVLPVKKRGRPPLLGEKLDKYLQEIIIAMRGRGTPISTNIIIGIGRGILLKHSKSSLEEFGGRVKLNKEWAKSVLRRMGFTKRRANSKSKIMPKNFAEIRENYLIDVESVIEMEEIPSDLVINWDQIGMHLVPSGSWTMEKRGTKRVEISALDDKRQITAVFGCSLSGNFLPVQLIYAGTTSKCLPKNVKFPNDWHVTYSANHWSNKDTMIDYIKNIIIPYIRHKRKELGLSSEHSAVVLFDVFKGQCVESIFKLLDDNNILYVLVPANCTDKLQPLDLIVNKPAKDFMKSRFQEWYSGIIRKQLDDGIEEDVDMRLSIMKPLSAQWIIELYFYLKSHPEIIINGFHAAGILK